MRVRRQRLGVLIAFVLGTMGAAATAAAMPIQFDFSSVFNADVIANSDPGEPGGRDVTQQGVDHGGAIFLTRAVDFAGGAHGLPDDGFFPAVSELAFPDPTSFGFPLFPGPEFHHPDLQLQYRDSDSGNNVRQSALGMFENDVYTVAVPALLYSDVFLFATTGNGDGWLNVDFTHADGSSSFGPVMYVPDWFWGPPSSSYDFQAFVLTSGRSRTNTTYSIYGGTGFSIFGYRIPVSPDVALASLTITAYSSQGVLNVFGGMGFALDGQVIPDPPSPVPEPATDLMLLAGIGAVAYRFSRRCA